MRRLRRWAFNLGAALSALLFVATAVAWRVNRTHFEEVSFAAEDQQWMLTVRPLGISVCHLRWPSGLAPGSAYTSGSAKWPPQAGWRLDSGAMFEGADFRSEERRAPGIWVGTFTAYDTSTATYVLLSYPWALAALAVVPLTWLWSAWRRRRIRRSGLCPACGYDLRATPDV